MSQDTLNFPLDMFQQTVRSIWSKLFILKAEHVICWVEHPILAASHGTEEVT